MSTDITLHGRLGQEPELRYAKTGTAVVKLSVVTNVRRKDGDAWVDADVTWWNVTAFKTLAENICETLKKGDEVIIVGKVKQRTWETPDGEKRSTFEVTADHVGPDLARATAVVTRTFTKSAAVNDHDPWATQLKAEDAIAAAPF